MHVMRLRNPWEFRDGPDAERISVVRRFGRPTNLGAKERVRLVFERLVIEGQITLNATPLGCAAPGETLRCDVTHQLAARNQIAIELSRTGAAQVLDTSARKHAGDFVGILIADVRLEIA